MYIAIQISCNFTYILPISDSFGAQESMIHLSTSPPS